MNKTCTTQLPGMYLSASLHKDEEELIWKESLGVIS